MEPKVNQAPNSMRKLLLLNIIVILILAAVGVGGYYLYYQSANYIKTDNAKIDGQQIAITAPMSGQLSDWTGEVGKDYKAGATIGSVTAGLQKVDVNVPQDGKIVLSNATKNSTVGAGTPLAYAFDESKLWVTANIDENIIKDVQVGQEVDIYVDSFTDTSLKGKISQIGLMTANTFSLLPSGNTTGNYTKVKQVIPVKVTIEDAKALAIVPGMSVTVRIHK